VKDRHNANILIDDTGAIIHIDFGFILGGESTVTCTRLRTISLLYVVSASPGMNINFESAPFKLTKEYVDLMGGIDSPNFKKFENLFVNGFLALRKTETINGLFAIIKVQ
jgi:phosphatidylinositol kinase/protein kinase (PI-3  family)